MPRRILYHTLLLLVPAAPSRGSAQGAQSSADVPLVARRGGQESTLAAELASRVKPGDELAIEDRSGMRTSGWLKNLAGNEITLDFRTGESHFTRDTIRTITLRRSHMRAAILVGAGAGAVWGALTECTPGKAHQCDEGLVMGPILGMLVGLGPGAFIHTSTVVYPLPEKRLSLLPEISRNTVGLRASMSW